MDEKKKQHIDGKHIIENRKYSKGIHKITK